MKIVYRKKDGKLINCEDDQYEIMLKKGYLKELPENPEEDEVEEAKEEAPKKTKKLKIKKS